MTDIVERLRADMLAGLRREEAFAEQAAKQDAEIERLRAKLSKCGGDNCMGRRVDGVTQWVTLDALEAVRAERDALRADALRYRWLRQRNAMLCCSIAWAFKDACEFSDPDAAIDAAMAAQTTDKPGTGAA